jgi:hypothetical protein
MVRTTAPFALLLALAAPAAAQSVYFDFGDPASPWGVPPATYGGVGPPGTWNGVASAPASGIVDTAGSPTGVTLLCNSPFSNDACDHAGTSGDHESLFDDRWIFDFPIVHLTVSGLAPGTYRVHVLLLVGPCIPMFTPMETRIAGATPPSAYLYGYSWTGEPVAGDNHTTHYRTIASGETLVIELDAPAGFVHSTQISGLQIVRVDPPAAFCSGDGSGTPCPCGNAGVAGRGCENSFATGGALLRMTFGGLASVAHDTVELSASGLPASTSVLYFQGTTRVNGGLGSVFGDGLRCAGGAVVRLATKVASSGSSSYPQPGDPLVSVRGMIPAAGGTRTYQLWYRNAAAFCSADTFNLSNGLELSWGP